MEDWERVALNERCRILCEQMQAVEKQLSLAIAELEKAKKFLEIKAENEIAKLPVIEDEGEYLPSKEV